MILSETCAVADELYMRRKSIDAVRESVDRLFLDANHETDYGIQWRLCRAEFFLGQEERDRNKKIAMFREGVRSGTRSIELNPDLVEGHFWLGVNLALLAEAVGSLTALGHVRQALNHLKIASDIDSSFHAAGPLRIRARLLHKLPWPLGSRKSSESLYREALSICPNNSVTRIFFADLLRDQSRFVEEKEQLSIIMSLPDDAEWNFELCRDKQLASERLGNDGSTRLRHITNNESL